MVLKSGVPDNSQLVPGTTVVASWFWVVETLSIAYLVVDEVGITHGAVDRQLFALIIGR